jgi:hypothetical protein
VGHVLHESRLSSQVDGSDILMGATAKKVNSNRFFNWEDFRDKFQKEFMPAHAELAAVSRQESTAYFQKGSPLDEYLDEFQDLLANSGYTDPKPLSSSSTGGLTPKFKMP